MDNYAMIENSSCTNVITADADFAKLIGAVALAAGYGIGDSYVNGVWAKVSRPKPEPKNAPPTDKEITEQALAELSLAQAQQTEQTQQALAELSILVAGGNA